MLDNSVKYQEAAKVTGPVDNSTLYRKIKNKQGRDEGNPIMFTIDDPYW